MAVYVITHIVHSTQFACLSLYTHAWHDTMCLMEILQYTDGNANDEGTSRTPMKNQKSIDMDGRRITC